MPTEDLTATFVSETKKAGMVGHKGTRDIGGIRVSAYNAVSVKDMETLVAFMEEFVRRNG